MASQHPDGDKPGSLPPSRGKPYIVDMDTLAERVDLLERDSREIKSILGRLEPAINKLVVDVAEMKGRLAQTPTTIQLIGLVFGIFAAALALLKFAG